MQNTAIYSGTFDPLTYGHIDLVKRATRLFDHIIVAIARNRSKSPLLNIKKRIELAQQVFADMPNIDVVGFEGLLIDFAQQRNVNVIIRGLRVVSDFDHEFQMASLNRRMHPALETIFLTPADQYTYVSSSLVREIAGLGGDVSEFVPSIVKEALQVLS